MSRPLFEHDTCRRCGGGGKYSFNLMHGSRCYGCGGSGFQLTKRGKAAQAFLSELRQRPAETVNVGDLVWFEGLTTGRFVAVTSIEPDTMNGGGRFHINGTVGGTHYGIGAFPGMKVRLGFTAPEKQAHIDAALAYQATLTKVGKPMKRAA